LTDAKGSGTGHGLSKRARAGGWGLSPSSSNVWPFKCRSPPARHTTLAVAAINQAHRAVPGLAESRASGSAKVHVPSNYTSSGMSRQCANRALRNPVQPQGRSFDHQSLRGPRSVASASRSSRSAQLNPSLALPWQAHVDSGTANPPAGKQAILQNGTPAESDSIHTTHRIPRSSTFRSHVPARYQARRQNQSKARSCRQQNRSRLLITVPKTPVASIRSAVGPVLTKTLFGLDYLGGSLQPDVEA